MWHVRVTARGLLRPEERVVRSWLLWGADLVTRVTNCPSLPSTEGFPGMQDSEC